MKYLLKTILLICFLNTHVTKAQPAYPQIAREAVLVSTDLINFIDAFKALEKNADTIAVLQSLYLDKATQGLKEYISRFDLNAAAISKAIKKYPEEYRKIEKFYGQIAFVEAEYIKEMELYKSVISYAMFPPTYLLVADYKGICQASKFGQLISIEKKCVDEMEQLKNLTVHELTHFQQAMSIGIVKYGSIYTRKDNLLDMVIREGVAEFITFKLVRNNVDQFLKLKNYEKKESAYWERFKSDLKDQDQEFWLNASYDNGIPVQLGYGLGYKIVESYFNRAEDKTKALYDILHIEDATAFLEKSDYSPKETK